MLQAHTLPTSLLILMIMLFSPGFMMSQGAIELANATLQELAQEEAYAPEDVASYIISDYYTSGGITHIYFKQAIDDIGIFNTNASVHIKDGQVIASNIEFIKGLSKRNIRRNQNVRSLEAIFRIALFKNYPVSQSGLSVIEEDNSKPDSPATIQADGVSQQQIPMNLVYVATANDDLELAWNVIIDEVVAGGNLKNFLVNAGTGAIEKELDLSITCTFDEHQLEHRPIPLTNNSHSTKSPAKNVLDNIASTTSLPDSSYLVFPMPLESPNFGSRDTVTRPWLSNSVASPHGWHCYNNTTCFTTTKGNNVDAYEDNDNTNNANNGDNDRAQGGSNLTFDFPLDLNGNPLNYKDAAVTNLFYWNNIAHDIFYNYGFDEPSGNFQQNNFGRGGIGNDMVYAEAQDGASTCNANFATPPEGYNPRMQMFLCHGRDSDLDNAIIVHEYGHGVSTRLTGGATTSCLNNEEQMGEGWSDFFGLIFTMDSDDTRDTTRSVATWMEGQDRHGAGLRPRLYATDMTINPMTYDWISKPSISQPHGTGSVWATMLWDLNWALIDLYGWDADLYNGNGGNNKVLRLVIEALKLQPCSPGFVDGRDAILAADQALYEGAHQCLIWEVFARRGLGYSANQGSSFDRWDGQEAFDLPPMCTINLTKVADKDRAPLGDTVTFTLSLTNNLSETMEDVVLSDSLPPQLEFYAASGNYSVNGQVITWSPVDMPGETTHQEFLVARINGELSQTDTLFTDDFESDTTNWVSITDSGVNTWVRTSSDYASSSHSFHAPGIAGISETALTTIPLLNLTNESMLSFKHWYNIEDGWDGGIVEISTDNGETWIDLKNYMTQNGYPKSTSYGFAAFTGSSGGWLETKVDLSSFGGEQALFRFKIITDYTIASPGWYIDDVKVDKLGLSVSNYASVINSDYQFQVQSEQPTFIDFALPPVVMDTCNTIENVDMTSEYMESGTYRSTDTITASFIVENGEDVKLYSSQGVSLMPGFEAKAGSDFLAKIEDCEEEIISPPTIIQQTPVSSKSNVDFSSGQQIRLNITPNPFGGTATIEYELKSPTDKFELYLSDLTGKRIRQIQTAEQMPAGIHTTYLYSDNLPNGVYWLSLHSEQHLTTKKVMILH